MELKRAAIAAAGLALLLLGILWLLQGAGVLELCPILCFADCACVRGGSLFWEATGALAVLSGIAVLALVRRSMARKRA